MNLVRFIGLLFVFIGYRRAGQLRGSRCVSGRCCWLSCWHSSCSTGSSNGSVSASPPRPMAA